MWSQPLDIRFLLYQMSRRGLTASSLAELAGVSSATIQKALRGRPARRATVVAIASALESQPTLDPALLGEHGSA